MKRLIPFLMIVLVATLTGTTVLAQNAHRAIGLGFHDSVAPIGIRYWLAGQKVAIDVGVGIESQDAGDESLLDFAFDFGVPIMARSWDRVHFLVRPGLQYVSNQVLLLGEKERASTLQILAELEAELFLANNMSVSASHGLSITNTSPPGDGDSSMEFRTFGRNLTEIGFHVYLFGE